MQSTDSPESGREPTSGPITFGQRLKGLLAERGISQAEFAKATGLERTELNRTINGGRQVQAHEIPWIAEALKMTVEELLKDVELPETVRRARQELEALAKRVLDAEGERDAAREQVDALERVLKEERRAHVTRMREVESGLEGVQSELATVRLQASAAERDLRSRLTETVTQNEGLGQTVSKLLAERRALHLQLSATRVELTSAQSAKVATGVLAGLAGLLLGSAGGRGGDDGA